ncbi:MAG: hypothetical protein AMS27_07685 [Bacteroides sp. SM23_62_1]|nr:MAG: hypothetical protein AMS27_07685 [Bacteroides sp. SM23_62_1]
MKKYLFLLNLILILLISAGQLSYSQGVLKKVKEKAEDKLIDKVFGEDQKTEEEAETPPSSSSSMSNTRGGGLVTTPPDVMENIAGAETAYKDKNFSDARYFVRQAMLGVEMEIGQNILKDFPGSVKGLNTVPEEDKVTSGGIGFSGLTIERVYRSSDQELRVTVANDAILLASVNMYLSSSAYATSTEENQKRVTFKGYRGILQYDESSGYTLSVPFGQSSIFVANGINFASEQEIMSAAEEFDIEKIKKELGEQ